MIERLIDWLIDKAKRDPYLHIDDYMERYWLIKRRWWLPFSIRVHHILRSDDDRHLHDHPWLNISIVLRGGYFEVTPKTQICNCTPLDPVWRKRGSIVFRLPSTRHRLVVQPGDDVWSLFIMGPKVQDWGFYLDDGSKVLWQDYGQAP